MQHLLTDGQFEAFHDSGNWGEAIAVYCDNRIINTFSAQDASPNGEGQAMSAFQKRKAQEIAKKALGQ